MSIKYHHMIGFRAHFQHVALGIPSEYREWRWLLSLLRREKDRLPPKEEIKRIKTEALARPITMVESAVNDSGRKKHSPPVQGMPVEKKPRIMHEGSSTAQEVFDEKKPKTSCAAREDSPAAPKLVIDLTSSRNKKKETVGSVPVTPAVLRTSSSIADRIAQRRSSSVPPVLKFMPKHSLGVKSDSPLGRLSTMKSGKTPSPAKVAPKLVHSAVETKLLAEKKETACTSGRYKSAKSSSREAAEICALLKPDLIEDMAACAKFVDGVKGIIGPSSFVKHTSEYRRTAMSSMMQKTAILAAESMVLDQEDTKATKEVARTMAAEAYSSVEKAKKLESELAVSRGLISLPPLLCNLRPLAKRSRTRLK